MKTKHLWFLLGALALLLVLRLLIDRSPDAASSLEAAGLPLLFDQGLDPEAVGVIRVTGPDSAPPLVAERGAAGWTLTSAHGAPADGEAIRAFLESLSDLRGEIRGEGEGLFAEFGVDDSTALRIELESATDRPLATLLVGRDGDARTSHFARRSGSDRIHHVFEGVIGDLGLVGGGRKPDPQRWLRLQLVDVGPETIGRIGFDRPDENWLLEKAAPPGAEEGATPEWRIVEPATGLAAKPTGIESWAGRLARVRASSVIDPAEGACASDGLKQHLTLRTRDGESGLRLGTRLLADDLVAAQVDGEATCWGLKRWTAQALLPRASQLLELPRVMGESAPELADFTRVDLVVDDDWLRVERDGEGWVLTQPQRAPADAARVDRLLSALRSLSWDDLAVEAAVAPADRGTHATITAHAGERSWTLRLLGERVGGFDSSRYAEFEGGPTAPSGYLAVVAESVVDSLTPSLDELRDETPDSE